MGRSSPKDSNARAASLEGKLLTEHVKLRGIEGQEAQWKKVYKEVNTQIVGLISQVEDLKGELVLATNKARGQGIQAGFKIFCLLLLQLLLDFNIKVLEPLSP